MKSHHAEEADVFVSSQRVDSVRHNAELHDMKSYFVIK